MKISWYLGWKTFKFVSSRSLYIPFCGRGYNWACHFGSYKQSKLRGTWLKGQNSLVKSSKLSWAGQYKKYVQYNFKFTSVYSVSTLDKNQMELEIREKKRSSANKTLSWKFKREKTEYWWIGNWVSSLKRFCWCYSSLTKL